MKTIRIKSLLFAIVSLLISVLVSSCGESDGQAELEVTFHDTLMDGSKISRIDMKVLETQIIDISDNKLVISSEPQVFNLLELTKNNPVVLAHTSIAPGTYKQIRLILDPNSTITLTDGTVQPLKVSSGEQTGIKIDGVFSIPAGRLYTLDIDLDPGRSVHFTNGEGYMLKPVIELSGSDINGGNFFYAGSYNSDAFVTSLHADGTLLAKTSRYPKYVVTGTYFHDGVNKKLTITPQEVTCPNCSSWDRLKMKMFADVPPASTYDVITFGADYLDLADGSGRRYHVFRVPTFDLGYAPPAKKFTVEVAIPDSAWVGKTILAQLVPKTGDGRVFTELATIPENLKPSFDFSIPQSEFGDLEKDYVLLMAIVESQDDIVLRSDGTVANLANVIAQNSQFALELYVWRDTPVTAPVQATFIASN